MSRTTTALLCFFSHARVYVCTIVRTREYAIYYGASSNDVARCIGGSSCGLLVEAGLEEVTVVGGGMVNFALEELDEIGGVFKTESIGNLFDHEVGVAEQALCLECDAIVDEFEGRIARTLVDVLGEGLGGDA